MPTDLSPAEKDDRETSRLIHKRPAPSRKNRSKRGPKHDNRRRRMKDTSDPDAEAAKRDRKASLADIALKVAFGGEEAVPGTSRFLRADALRALGRGEITADEVLTYGEAGAASYGTPGTEDMSSKTAAYHGIVQQGHPSGPTNSGHSPDKRYFDKSSYDSILAHAKELLKTDWLQYGWEGGAEDAPIRAALDLSIQLANDHAYQSKVDVETYNMLLVRLSKSDVDLFSDTLVPEGGNGKRSAAAMDKNLQSMIRVANDLRKSNPRAAFEIMKNVRAIRVAQVPVESQIQHQGQDEKKPGGEEEDDGGESEAEFFMKNRHLSQQSQGEGQQQPPATVRDDGQNAPPTVRQPPAGGGDQTSQQQQQGGLTKGPNVKDVHHQLDLLSKARTPDDFMEALTKIKESVSVASRVATSAGEELAPIADMSDEEIQKLVQMSKRDVTKLEDVMKGFDDAKPLSGEELEAFVKGVDDFINGIVAESEKVKTASVSVPVSALLRVASISPEARMVMMPFLAAAKKKMDKAAKKKKTKKKAPAKKKGGNPFAKGGPLSKSPAKGGKKGPPSKGKAPPFGGKKAPPFGKKKASVDISPDDTKW